MAWQGGVVVIKVEVKASPGTTPVLYIAFRLKPSVAGIGLSGHLVGAMSRRDAYTLIWDAACKSLRLWRHLQNQDKKTKTHTVGLLCEDIVLWRLAPAVP